MRVEIHDVGHGACAVVTCPNGAQAMLDCGYRRDPGWFPSVTYSGGRLALLGFTNLDEDHVADLPHLWSKVGVGALFSNQTVSPDALAAMKRQQQPRSIGQCVVPAVPCAVQYRNYTR